MQLPETQQRQTRATSTVTTKRTHSADNPSTTYHPSSSPSSLSPHASRASSDPTPLSRSLANEAPSPSRTLPTSRARSSTSSSHSMQRTRPLRTPTAREWSTAVLTCLWSRPCQTSRRPPCDSNYLHRACLGTVALLHNSLDPVQLTQMAKYLETVYVSGWQSSSTASSTNEPGPDLAGESRECLRSLEGVPPIGSVTQ